MSNPKITVIISVYNEEKYLRKSLDTVCNQKLGDIEIICINDKSTDSSYDILKEYADKDSRIILINNEENLGLGQSRNNALEIAKGEYISFVDGDDWVDENIYEVSYNEAKKFNTDITMFKTVNYNNDDGTFHENSWSNLDELSSDFDDTVFDSSKTKDFLFKLPVSACQKIYRRKFLEDINAKFPPKIYFEDNPFFYYVWLKASRISIVRKPFYVRRVHQDSITGKVDRKWFDIIPSGILLSKIFVDNNFYDDYKKDLVNHRINAYRLTMDNISDDLKEEFFILSKDAFKNIYDSEYCDDYLKYMHPDNRKIFTDILSSNNIDEFMLKYYG